MTRDEAKLAGSARYDGAPCSNGHAGRRYTSNMKCCDCLRGRNRYRMREKRAAGRGWADSLLGGARRRAKRQGVECTVTRDWLQAELDRGVCAVSGMRFDLTTGRGRWQKFPFTPSLDRIVARGDYTPGNCRVVCLIVNEAMNRWGVQPLLTLAQHMVKTR